MKDNKHTRKILELANCFDYPEATPDGPKSAPEITDLIDPFIGVGEFDDGDPPMLLGHLLFRANRLTSACTKMAHDLHSLSFDIMRTSMVLEGHEE